MWTNWREFGFSCYERWDKTNEIAHKRFCFLSRFNDSTPRSISAKIQIQTLNCSDCLRGNVEYNELPLENYNEIKRNVWV